MKVLGKDHGSDAKSRQEIGRKRLDIDDPVLLIQIMKRRSIAAIKISQIVVLNKVDIILVS